MIHVCIVNIPNMPQLLARFNTTNELKKYGLPEQLTDIELYDNCGNDMLGQYDSTTWNLIDKTMWLYVRKVRMENAKKRADAINKESAKAILKRGKNLGW